MNTRNHLTDLGELILRAIVNLAPHRRYKSGIKAFLEQQTERVISYGAVHESLTRLKKRGLVESQTNEMRSQYTVTTMGIDALYETKRIRESMPLPPRV